MSQFRLGIQEPDRPMKTLGISGKLKHVPLKAAHSDIEVGDLLASTDTSTDVNKAESAAEHLRAGAIADQPKESVVKGTYRELPVVPTTSTKRYIFSDNENIDAILLTPGDHLFLPCADASNNIYLFSIVTYNSAGEYVELMSDSLQVPGGGTAMEGTTTDANLVTGENVPLTWKFMALEYRGSGATATWLKCEVIGK